MKITREEFKELKELHTEAWAKCRKYQEIINEELLYEIMFPTLDWIENKLELDFFDLFELGWETPVAWEETEDGVIVTETSADLDVIYDKLLAEAK